MFYILSWSVVGILILAVVLDYILEVKPDPREPTFIAPKIPVIGHLIGIFIEKQPYFVNLRKKNPSLPIYGLSVLGSRIYIVNSPEIAVAIQLKAKSLSFVAYGAKFADAIFKLSAPGREILLSNVRGDNGVTGFGHDYINAAHYALAFGPRLDELSLSVVEGATLAANKLMRAEGPTRIQLSEWIRRELTLAATNAVYGPSNPLADDESDAAYLHFERGLTALLFLPRFIARKAAEGRQHTVEVLSKYISSSKHLTGSKYIQSRLLVGPKWQMEPEDVVRMELGGLTALTATANPTAFWLVCAIYSRPELLQTLREELQRIIVVESTDAGKTYILDVTKIKETCKVFISTFQETLRWVSLGSTIRLVLDDTLINDRYLLKKDAVIMIPAKTLHSDAALYGPDADQFDPYRFVAKAKGTGYKIPQGAFRAFGGGSSLCPGRHFAATEIFALVGLLILRYDLSPTTDKEWKIPPPNTNNMAVAVPCAQGDIEVDVSPRKGWDDGNWKAITTPLTTKFDPVSIAN